MEGKGPVGAYRREKHGGLVDWDGGHPSFFVSSGLGHASARDGRRRAALWSRARRQLIEGKSSSRSGGPRCYRRLGGRGMCRRDGRICPALTPPSVHPRALHPPVGQHLRFTGSALHPPNWHGRQETQG